MPKINIYNRSGIGVVLQTGKTAGGKWSGDPTKTSLKANGSKVVTASGSFGVTASPVGAPEHSANWRGTPTGELNLYIVASANSLQISLHDPDL